MEKIIVPKLKVDVVLPPLLPRRSLEKALYRIAIQGVRNARSHRSDFLAAATELRKEMMARDGLTNDGPRWEWVRRRFKDILDALSHSAEAMIERLLKVEAVRHSARWIEQVNAAIGVDLKAIVTEDQVAGAINIAVDHNISLINGLNADVLKRIENTIFRMVTAGKATQAIADELDKQFQIGARRARLIARDQAGKFNGSLNRIRQEQAGITEFMWWTVHDERVRGNPEGKYPNAKPSHWDRHGKTYAWSKPPADGAPGEPIQCRCIARPVFKAD